MAKNDVPWRNANIVVRGDEVLIVVNSASYGTLVVGKIDGFVRFRPVSLEEYDED